MGVWRGLVVVCAVGAWGGVAAAQRLPGGVRPEHYALVLTPDLKAATFAGAETIDVVLDRPATEITLNAAEISFISVKAFVGAPGPEQKQIPFGNDKQEGNGEQSADVTLDAAKEQATLTFAQPLPAGPVTLAIAYTGFLNNKLRGFYLSKTKLRSYGVTQFEATDARRAFPSFDEPALKATFDITLVVDAGDAAISNMNEIADTPGPTAGKHTVRFATTPKMSTYLVAFLVGDFQCASGKSDGIAIRACATPDKVALTPFAVDAAKHFLHYYDKYFGIKYPLPKLDMVAIPDFEAGAMENFGCITYRETEMLVDAKDGPLPAKKEVAETIAHEMSHMWFGDMVTPQWWNDLWLNEGLATWMETKAAEQWHPEWGYEQSVADDQNNTMDEDSARTTRAVRADAETPAAINELFDDIAYGKAGAVLRMVENYVGDEVFQQGVQAYLNAHLYGNATAEDFWGAQTKTSGKPVDAVMKSFIEQPGVPLVNVATTSASVTAVEAGAFLLRPVAAGAGQATGSFASREWTIPVCVAANKAESCKLLTPGFRPEALAATGSKPLLYANRGDKGYYRTNYAPDELTAIVANAETALTPPERIGLLGDRWALMRAGQGSVGEFLDLTLALKSDPNAAVLDDAVDRIGEIKSKIASDDDRARLDAVIRSEWAPVYAAMATPGKHESYDRREVRGALFGLLGDAKDPAVLTEAAELTKELFDGKNSSNPAVTDAAVTVTVAHGDAAMYDKLLHVAQTANDPDLKVDALHTLTSFLDPPLVARTLEYASSGQVRNQDSWTLFALLLRQRETRDQAWAYVQAHWDAIAAQGTINSNERIVEATGAFCSANQRDAVQRFFMEHPVVSAERTLKKALDSIDDCVQLRETQEPKLNQWLNERK